MTRASCAAPPRFTCSQTVEETLRAEQVHRAKTHSRMETFKPLPEPVTACEAEKYKEMLVLTRQPSSRLNEHFDPTC